MAKERNSSMELMRLIAMYMIVIGHCALSTAKNVQPYLSTIDNIGWLIGAFTVCAVNMFFLLSGYFAKSNTERVKKILIIWFKTVFYSFSIYLVVSLLTKSFGVLEAISYAFPVFMRKYWYMQVYIPVALLTPYILIALEKITIKKHIFIVSVLLA